ncbi:MAG: preprotein translocase subunit YajC [Alistipes sp.]|nr:preprotein translocase subunit YajC [Alistipes sp.]
MLIMSIVMVAIVYFFMWRPESKRRKQMERFRKNLKEGDKVITAEGIYATVKEIRETTLLIEIERGARLVIDKGMVVGDPTQGVVR